MCTTEDLRFGYMDADFIRENDEICGILLAREDNIDKILVLFKTSDFSDVLHQTVTLTAECREELGTQAPIYTANEPDGASG